MKPRKTVAASPHGDDGLADDAPQRPLRQAAAADGLFHADDDAGAGLRHRAGGPLDRAQRVVEKGAQVLLLLHGRRRPGRVSEHLQIILLGTWMGMDSHLPSSKAPTAHLPRRALTALPYTYHQVDVEGVLRLLVKSLALNVKAFRRDGVPQNVLRLWQNRR